MFWNLAGGGALDNSCQERCACGRKSWRRYLGLFSGFSIGGGGVGVGDGGTYHGVWCNWPSVWWTEPRSEPDYSSCSYMVLGGVAAQYVVGNDCIMF